MLNRVQDKIKPQPRNKYWIRIKGVARYLLCRVRGEGAEDKVNEEERNRREELAKGRGVVNWEEE